MLHNLNYTLAFSIIEIHKLQGTLIVETLSQVL